MAYAYSGNETNILEEIYEWLYYGLGIVELGTLGTILVGGIIAAIVGAVVGFVISVIVYILEAFPIYKLSKKAGRRYAWLAWVPIFGKYFRLYALADIPGSKEVGFFGKFSIKSRSMAFWIYLGIAIFGNSIISAVMLFANVIPVLGQIISLCSALLFMVPFVATGIMEYAFLRDVLNLFKEDKKSNRIAAIVVTVLDNIATLGFARVIYLYTLLKKEPIPETSGKIIDGTEEIVEAEPVKEETENPECLKNPEDL